MTDLPQLPSRLLFGTATAAYQIEGAVGRGRPRRRRSGTPSATARPHPRRRHRRRRLRPLPPVRRGRRADGRPRRRRLPVLDRLAAGPADRRGRGQPGRAGLLRPAGRRAAGRRDRAGARRCSTGTCRRRCRTPAAGCNRDTAHRFAEYADVVAERLGDRVAHVDHAQRAGRGHLARATRRHPRPRPRRSASARCPVAHHQLLGHGLAVRRCGRPAPATIGDRQQPPARPGRRRDSDPSRREAADRRLRRAAQPAVHRPDPARPVPRRARSSRSGMPGPWRRRPGRSSARRSTRSASTTTTRAGRRGRPPDDADRGMPASAARARRTWPDAPLRLAGRAGGPDRDC